MDDATLLTICVFGVVAMVTMWLGRRLVGTGDGRLRSRLRSNEASPLDESRSRREELGSVITRISSVAAKPFEPSTREKQSQLRRQLGRAGIYSMSAVRLMLGLKVILLGAGLVGGYLAGLAMGNTLLGLSVGGLAGYITPSMWLKSRISAHRLSLDRSLPDAIDLLVVCVEAGLTVDNAMQRVGQELAISHPALARELDITHMETRVGLSRAEALRNMANRTGSRSLGGLVAMLVQADRFGTSIADALRIHAESMRLERQHAAEELAAKATVKLSFPVVLFIFPAVLIVLAGPAVLGLMNSALFK